MKSVLMGASHHLQMSHCPPVRSRLTQVRFLPAVVRFRLHDEPGLRQWGQEDTWREESQEEERLRQVERRFVASEPVENFEEMGHLRHLGHLGH